MSEMDHFIVNVQEALNSLVGGLELERPSAATQDALGASRNFALVVKQEPQLLTQFEDLLDNWCTQIQKYLDDSDKPIQTGEEDLGPRTELEYWRNKMQRLTSIAEQLKRKDCRQVITSLSTLTKNSSEPRVQKVIALLRRWKEKDVLTSVMCLMDFAPWHCCRMTCPMFGTPWGGMLAAA